MFESLGRADLDELIENFPPEEQKLLVQLSHGNPQHSLMISSFPELTARVLARKQNGLEVVQAGWWILGLSFAIIGGILLTRWYLAAGGRASRIGELLFVVLIIGMLAGLLLPAVQRARESSRRGTALNDLRQIALSIENLGANGRINLNSTDGKDLSGNNWVGEDISVRNWFPETLLWRRKLSLMTRGTPRSMCL